MRFGILLGIGLLLVATLAPVASAGVRVIGIRDPITPVTARFLHRNLEEAALQRDQLVLIEMDTPGGLDTAMRGIVQDLFASATPVAVYVAPSGARAASAGAIICLAADICAMAPGTNIGAAHPVSMGVTPDKIMNDKLVNDAEAYAEGIARQRGRDEVLARKMVRESLSLSADKAREGGIADLVAASRGELLQALEGRRIVRDSGDVTLHLAGVEVFETRMGRVERILAAISNPNVAYVLMILGMLGLFFELSNPGVILPGVIGGICLILAFFAFQALPVNYAGILLILLALVLFIAEIKIVSSGMLTVGGVVAMILGSLLLFESTAPWLRVSWSVILITVLATAGFFVVVVAKAVKAHRRRPTTGMEGLIGLDGIAQGALDPGGKVFVRGEYWDAVSDEPIAAGSGIVVEAVEGMRLRVRKAETIRQ